MIRPKGKTLYISDLDGTLLDKNAKLSKYSKASMNAMIADGMRLSVATARTAASAAVILDGVRWDTPLVLMNGVLIANPALKQYVQILPLPTKTVSAVIILLKSLGVTGLMYQMKDAEQQTYYETLEHKPLRDFIEERQRLFHKSFRRVGGFSEVEPENIIYFTLLNTKENLRGVYDALTGLPGIGYFMYKDIYSPDLWYLEVHSDKASKKNGVEFLREACGFEYVVGFGDNINDLPMFEACDTKVAVANAREEVLAAADVICGPNDGDGVIKWIEANASSISHLQ